jgi:hypothetical protein
MISPPPCLNSSTTSIHTNSSSKRGDQLMLSSSESIFDLDGEKIDKNEKVEKISEINTGDSTDETGSFKLDIDSGDETSEVEGTPRSSD